MEKSSSMPWLSLVGIVFLQSVSSTISNFPAYSIQLTQILNISGLQLNNLIVAWESGRLLDCFSTAAADRLPAWLMLIISMVLGFVGYGVQFLFLVNKITYLPYWQLPILHLLAGNSISWINTVCYGNAMRNFTTDYPTVMALTSSYAGLSGKLYTLLVEGFHGSGARNASTYLFLNCVVPVGAGLVFLALVRQPKPGQTKTEDAASISFMLIIASATSLYTVFDSVAPVIQRVSPRLRVVVVLLMIMLPAMVPIVKGVVGFTPESWHCKRMMSQQVAPSGQNPEGNGGESCISIQVKEEKQQENKLDGGESCISIQVKGEKQEEKKLDGGESCISIQVKGEKQEEKKLDNPTKNVMVGDEHGVKQLVLSVNFWLYFWVYSCGATLSTVYFNNLGRITKSCGYAEAPFLLAISSSFGYFGRLFAVMLEWLTREKNMLSRPLSMVVLMIPMAASFFLLVNVCNDYLYISTEILGICSGIITTIALPITSDLFGSKNSSINHKILLTNIPLGSLLYGSLAAMNFDREDHASDGICMGPQCYRQTFIIWGLICSFGTVLSLILYYRTRKYYRKCTEA